MRKNFLIIVLSLFTFNSTHLLSLALKDYNYLGQTKESKSSLDDAKTPDDAHELFVALHGFQLDYKEIFDDPEAKSTESGFMYGFSAAFNTKRSNGLFGAALLQYCKMDEDYDGKRLSGEALTGKSNSSFLRLDATANYSINVEESNFFVIPYIGVSYRIWNRNIMKDVQGGYEEKYSWFTIPVGCELRYVSENYAYGIKAGIGIMIKGEIEVDFSRVQPGIPIITMTLGNKLGYNFSGYFEYFLNKSLGLRFEPYFEYYGFNKSDPTLLAGEGYIYEPESNTHNFGANLGVVFNIW